MKKLSIFLLALVACAGTMFASDTSVGGIWYNFDDEHLTAEVTYQGDEYDSYSDTYFGEVVIPSSVTYNTKTYSVTSIGHHAFYRCSGLTSVTLPNTVTSIGHHAFYDCTGLTSVTIGNSVTSIGESAFYGCSKLTSVEIPNSVTSIGGAAFASSNLTTIDVALDNPYFCSEDGVLFNRDKTTLVAYLGGKQGAYTIPNSVTSIGIYAFDGCTGLTSVTIPNSVTSIGYCAFYECIGLTSVTIPNSVTSIGIYAFDGCTGLTSVTIGNSVTSIGYGAFGYCSGLTSLSVEAGNTVYDSRNNCNAIIETSTNTLIFGCQNTTIPNSVTSIGSYAFSRCTSLTSVTIPNSVTSIGEGAFEVCTGLTSVTIPNSVTSIGNYAFLGCDGLTSVTNYATTPQIINSNVFEYVDISACILNVPKESVSLYQAAEGWKEFTHIVGVDVPGEDTSVDGIWYNFDDEHITAEVTYQGDYSYSYSNEYSGEVVIPSSVTYNSKTYSVASIGEGAFWDCSGLTSVTLPNSVTSIGNGAFYGCSGLTSVTIPSSVDSIGDRAFVLCNGLTSVEIPNSVTSIGDGAFGYCSGLTSLSVEAGNTVYDSRNNCNAIIKTSTNTLISGCQNTTIPNSVTSIGYGAFGYCSGLTSVTIPNSVTSIGYGAFAYCSGLTSVTIPNSVTSIGDNAFSGCSKLTSVTNYTTTPQTIYSDVFGGDEQYPGVDKSTCVLNVPKESVSLYQAAEGWKEFTHIVGVDVPGEDTEEPIETVEGDYTINYVDKDSQALYNHVVTLYVPVAPTITGFTFVGWQTVSTMLTDGITLQAVYQAEEPSSAPAVYTNPANPAQKLIRNGNVYILTDDKTYSIDGRLVR